MPPRWRGQSSTEPFSMVTHTPPIHPAMPSIHTSLQHPPVCFYLGFFLAATVREAKLPPHAGP